MQNEKESQPPSKMACLPQPIVRTSKADHCLRRLSSILVQRAQTGINKSELKSQRYFSFTTGDMCANSLASEPLCGHLGSRQESSVHRTGAAWEVSGAGPGSSGPETCPSHSPPAWHLDVQGVPSSRWVGQSVREAEPLEGGWPSFAFGTSVERLHGVVENIYIFVIFKFPIRQCFEILILNYKERWLIW